MSEIQQKNNDKFLVTLSMEPVSVMMCYNGL